MVVLDNSWKVKLAVHDQETKILVTTNPDKDKMVLVIREESPKNACI